MSIDIYFDIVTWWYIMISSHSGDCHDDVPLFIDIHTCTCMAVVQICCIIISFNVCALLTFNPLYIFVDYTDIRS